ncbi:MAG: ribosomal protein S18-alanine N-acetyltransferase [Pseudomonadales bacterium]
MREYRPLQQSDLSALCALETQCFEDAWSSSLLERQLAAPRTLNFACIENGQLCGFIFWSYVCDEAELLRVAVAPAARGQGLATELIGRSQQYLTQGNISQAFLEVRASNSRALSVYARCGYVQTGRRKGYYRSTASEPAEDALLLSCTLGVESV